MCSSEIIPLQDGSVRYQGLTFKPFPRLELTGESTACSQAVYELLRSEEVFAVIWRGKIRPSLLKALLRYEPRHAALTLLLAQQDPYRFTDWTEWNPALIQILLHWINEPMDGWQLAPDEGCKLFKSRWQDLLAAADLPPTKAFLRLLAKIPFDEVTVANLTLLKQACMFPLKAKLASHVGVLNTVVIDTLQLPFRYLSIDLLERAATEALPPGVESVRQLCLDIVDCRVQQIDEVNWPFQNTRVSLEHLAAYLHQLQLKLVSASGAMDFAISPPPLEAVKQVNFEAHPLNTLGAIFTEAGAMQNCLQCYASQIAEGRYYAYKILRPERATVLLVKNCDLWVPAQVRAMKNNLPRPETIEAIETWLGQSCEPEDADAPF